MGKTLAEKIIEGHLTEGTLDGEEISVKIDQTLTQDATGTMAYLQFESLGIPKAKTELSVSYIDHNTLQSGFENADDHRYLQSVAAKYGLYLSRPGNGICHQLHLERFAIPGKTLLGSDSHTPTAGGMAMIAMGSGGLDIALAMAGTPYSLKTPKIVGISLTGKLSQWVSAKDVIMEVLRRIDVKGGKGKILEYYGEGVKTLTVPDRATITNMGTETGATTSIFPSDEITKEFLASQGREGQWVELKADDDANYDETIEIDLSEVVPMVAQPHSPGKVVPVSEIEGLEAQQVAIGSCTNSSYTDLMKVAAILKGKTVSPNLSACMSPGSRQVLTELIENGALADIVSSGVRMLECTCGPCIGMGQSPPSASVTIRTFNRNFEGRSGTKDAQIYLVSPETAAATALEGKLTDPRKLGDAPKIPMPEKFQIDDSMIIAPPKDGSKSKVLMGPNIKPLPIMEELSAGLSGEVLIKVEDNITTDHIMPAGAKILPLRSNIPKISEHVFEQLDPEFYQRAMDKKGGFILGGENYGQGSSREHAALAPMYLGIKAVFAKSFARIHRNNLVNFGILPLLVDADAYGSIAQGDALELSDVKAELTSGDTVSVKNTSKGSEFTAKHDLGEEEIEVICSGGRLNFTKKHA